MYTIAMSKKKKTKMGRPPIPNAKTTFVGLKISAKEKGLLTKAAKKAGISLSAYIMLPHRKVKE